MIYTISGPNPYVRANILYTVNKQEGSIKCKVFFLPFGKQQQALSELFYVNNLIFSYLSKNVSLFPEQKVSFLH